MINRRHFLTRCLGVLAATLAPASTLSGPLADAQASVALWARSMTGLGLVNVRVGQRFYYLAQVTNLHKTSAQAFVLQIPIPAGATVPGKIGHETGESDVVSALGGLYVYWTALLPPAHSTLVLIPVTIQQYLPDHMSQATAALRTRAVLQGTANTRKIESALVEVPIVGKTYRSLLPRVWR